MGNTIIVSINARAVACVSDAGLLSSVVSQRNYATVGNLSDSSVAGAAFIDGILNTANGMLRLHVAQSQSHPPQTPPHSPTEP